jgi:uncharacterized membrane protein
MSLQRVAFQLRNSLWFVPGLWVIGAGVLAVLATGIDAMTPAIGRDLPLVFGGGPDGARSVLSSIAGSMITVAGVTFSITIVALQLASSQFSPRVLRDFMRDRLSQSVLGSFIGAFFYSLVVLRSIRSADETGPEFVPAIAVTLAIGFAVLAVAMLIYFIHHISTRIQVSSIVAGIADATERAIERERDDGGSAARPGGKRPAAPTHDGVPQGQPGRVTAARSGYLQLLDRRGIVDVAEELDLVVRLEHAPGDWVQEGAPLFAVWPSAAADEELADRLNDHATIGAERSLEQDPAFGMRQLVDVAVKALSPGINDPTTARDCIARITQVLVAWARAGAPRDLGAGRDGRLRLVERVRSFAELVELGFDELRHYGAATPEIAITLAASVRTLRDMVSPTQRSPLDEQLERLREAAAAITPPSERSRVLARISEPTSR